VTDLMVVVAAALAALVAFNVLLWPRVRPAAPAEMEPVSVLIPARNEEKNLPACLDAALAQPGVAEVLVYDDHSEDGTAAAVARYARSDPRVRYLAPQPLPSGWRGKTFACHTLARQAASPWLLFLDADARLAPQALGGVLAEAQRRGVTLLAAWPGLDMRGFAEKLLMPMLNFVVLTLYPAPLAIRRPGDASLGLAHGALMLARKDAYERVGGLSEDYLIGDYEDSDLCLKLRGEGKTIRYEPAAELYHFERRSIARNTGYTRGVADAHNRWLHHQRWRAAIGALMETACVQPAARRTRLRQRIHRQRIAREQVVASWAKRLSGRSAAAALPALVGAMSAAMAESDGASP